MYLFSHKSFPLLVLLLLLLLLLLSPPLPLPPAPYIHTHTYAHTGACTDNTTRSGVTGERSCATRAPALSIFMLDIHRRDFRALQRDEIGLGSALINNVDLTNGSPVPSASSRRGQPRGASHEADQRRNAPMRVRRGDLRSRGGGGGGGPLAYTTIIPCGASAENKAIIGAITNNNEPTLIIGMPECP